MSSDRPRVGFAGIGWIGRHRMQALVDSGLVEVAAIADPDPQLLHAAAELAPAAVQLPDLDSMLRERLDGLVIATPSALHAAQSRAALEHGMAVFCQKPLGRDAAETRMVVAAARAADRLLAADLSYRFVRGMERAREVVQSGELGRMFAAELVFHNAYGPDKAWYYEPDAAGGGCLVDLGIHLVDLALWILGARGVETVSGRVFAGGEPVTRRGSCVDDFASARLDLDTGASVSLACSWRLSAGQDAVISAAFYGTEGGVAVRNVGGSFYDFVTERFRGTQREVLDEPPDAWGGRAAVHWAEQLAAGRRYQSAAEELVLVAEVLDAIYASSATGALG